MAFTEEIMTLEKKDYNLLIENYKRQKKNKEILRNYKNIGAVDSIKELKAVIVNTKIIELDNNNHEAFINRAKAYSLLEKYKEALADFTKAIELDPNYPAPYFFKKS